MFVAFVSYETQCLGWYLSVKDTLLFVSCHHHKNISKGKWLSSFLWEQPLVLLMCRSNKDRKDVDIEQLGGTLVRLVQTKWQCYRVSAGTKRWSGGDDEGCNHRMVLNIGLDYYSALKSLHQWCGSWTTKQLYFFTHAHIGLAKQKEVQYYIQTRRQEDRVTDTQADGPRRLVMGSVGYNSVSLSCTLHCPLDYWSALARWADLTFRMQVC